MSAASQRFRWWVDHSALRRLRNAYIRVETGTAQGVVPTQAADAKNAESPAGPTAGIRLPRVSIVVPTYNEAGNVERFLSAVDGVMRERAAWDYRILVVDDSSPDGTSQLVQKWIQHHPAGALLIRREKEGLGAAYLAGFNYALKHFSPEILVQMDADLSHPPEQLPILLDALNTADVAVGSRYVQGGRIHGWPLHRHLVSRGGNGLARFVAGIDGVNDVTSGFRAIRAPYLVKAANSLGETRGYAFQISLLRALQLQGARMHEAPVDFVNRTVGASKLAWTDVFEFAITALKLAFTRLSLVRPGDRG